MTVTEYDDKVVVTSNENNSDRTTTVETIYRNNYGAGSEWVYRSDIDAAIAKAYDNEK